MNRTILVGIVILLSVICISIAGGEKQAVAGYGCHGCYGVTVYSGYRTCWGRPYLLNRPILARCYGACYGWPACYGYAGCYGCGGCYGVAYYGCYGCDGCWGTPVLERREVPKEATPKASGDSAATQDKTSQRSDRAVLNVQVPVEAKVVINGLTTRSTGDQRRYVSRGLVSGHVYQYEVQAEIEHEGKRTTQTQRVTLQAGQDANLVFDLPTSGGAPSVASRPVDGPVQPTGDLQSVLGKSISR